MTQMVVMKGDHDWVYVRVPQITDGLRATVQVQNDRLDEAGEGDDRIAIEDVPEGDVAGLGDDLLWVAETPEAAAEMVECWVDATV